jgi:hypothetical protein
MTALVLSHAVQPWTFGLKTASAGKVGQQLHERLLDARLDVGGATQNWHVYMEPAFDAIAVECSTPDWDGAEAEPITQEVMNRARTVADILYRFVPRGTPAPDVVPEADGEVALSWTRAPDAVFSISIGSHNKLNYAGRLGGGTEPHDVVEFDPGNPTTIESLAPYISELFR